MRYPADAQGAVMLSGAEYAGYLPNHLAPETFARFRATVHVPRRYYSQSLPGIPTIRVFEALACGIPLVSSPWQDTEGLFRPGTDFLMADDRAGMEAHLRAVLNDAGLRESLIGHGLETIHNRHTCAHRVDELLGICRGIGNPLLMEAR
ncbi:MAG TPA: glycosyltransferase [Arenibaculum sp.]|nr:glycosyltransferase [Arenibaculum sp.]